VSRRPTSRASWPRITSEPPTGGAEQLVDDRPQGWRRVLDQQLLAGHAQLDTGFDLLEASEEPGRLEGGGA
jgi:hypothetical protein